MNAESPLDTTWRAHGKSDSGETPDAWVLVRPAAHPVPIQGAARAAGYTPDSPWSPALDAKLIQMWYDGLPTAVIGDRLGVSKNSVIGRKNRLELVSRGSPIKNCPVAKPKRKPIPIALPLSASIMPPPDPHAAPPVHWRPIRSAPLPIPRGAIGPARTCQWTDCKRAPWLFCDGATLPGYSWCEGHKARVFRVCAE